MIATVLTLLALPLIWRDLTSGDDEAPDTTTSSSTTVAVTSSTTILLDPEWVPKGSSRYGATSDGTTTTAPFADDATDDVTGESTGSSDAGVDG